MYMRNCVKIEGWQVSVSISSKLKARGKWQKDIHPAMTENSICTI